MPTIVTPDTKCWTRCFFARGIHTQFAHVTADHLTHIGRLRVGHTCKRLLSRQANTRIKLNWMVNNLFHLIFLKASSIKNKWSLCKFCEITSPKFVSSTTTSVTVNLQTSFICILICRCVYGLCLGPLSCSILYDYYKPIG